MALRVSPSDGNYNMKDSKNTRWGIGDVNFPRGLLNPGRNRRGEVKRVESLGLNVSDLVNFC